MKFVELPGIPETVADYEKIEAAIVELFRREIYLPLIKLVGLPSKTLKNSLEDLVFAVSSGRVTFYRGHFRGRFSAGLSRELKRLGAEWDRKQGSWKIPLTNLPRDLQTAIGASEDRIKRVNERVIAQLEALSPENLADKFKGQKLFDTVVWKVDKKFQEQVEKIAFVPKLTADARAKIAQEYTQNLRLYIKEWTEEEIVKLRKRVEKSATAGNRYESLISTIQKSYGVSQNKAKFLARQETSLLMSKFKETRYRDAGSEEYIWRCVAGSANHPVRPFHKKLDGTRQRWDSPPIIDKNGNRKHPGEDYGCRCTARPVVKF